MFRFDDKIVVVTGAGRGMGNGVAKILGKLGATVCMLDINEDVLAAAKELTAKEVNAFGYVCDVSNIDNVKCIFEKIISEHGTIHKLANVAGISASVDFLSEEIDLIKDRIMNVNFNGVWNTCRVAIPYMLNNGSGSIVNFSSVTGNLVSDPGMAAYAASKGAVSGLTRSLAIEFANRNININAILPGYVWTEMLSKYNPSNPQEIKDKFSKGIPMGRLGTIEEAGSVVAFLLSDEARYITGHCLIFDGGTTLVETKELVAKGQKKL